ncbi:MAG: hypothetical protein ABIH49_01750 [archaeon]
MKSGDGFLKSRSGQATIFIILAIILVSSIALFLVFRGDVRISISGGNQGNTNVFLDSCLKDKIKDVVETISLQGGDIENPLSVNFQFDNEEFRNVSYLCYTQSDYSFCVNQKPALKSHIESEIKKEIQEDVDSCFEEMATSFRNQGFDVNPSDGDFSVSIIQDKIFVDIDKSITATRNEETTTQSSFRTGIVSNLGNLIDVAKEVINKEATECDFEQVGYEAFYPEYEIDKTSAPDSSIIYTIKYRDTGEKFRFAVRNCVGL